MTIIFSDTHLTHHFDQKFFDKFKKAIQPADTIIINGDFWDAFLTTFEQFITSDWQPLFKLLKSKKTIYIYGNHDLEKFADKRLNLFSNKQLQEYTFKKSGTTFRVEHGHRIAPDLSKGISFLPSDKQTSLNKFLKQSPGIKYIYKLVSWYFDIQSEKKIINYLKTSSEIKKDIFYIFGHSHIPRINHDLKYANPGNSTAELLRYLAIDIKGKVEVKKI